MNLDRGKMCEALLRTGLDVVEWDIGPLAELTKAACAEAERQLASQLAPESLRELVARLAGYNPPDRTVDGQRQIAQDISDASAALTSLAAEVERLAIGKTEWKQIALRHHNRAEAAEREVEAVADEAVDRIIGDMQFHRSGVPLVTRNAFIKWLRNRLPREISAAIRALAGLRDGSMVAVPSPTLPFKVGRTVEGDGETLSTTAIDHPEHLEIIEVHGDRELAEQIVALLNAALAGGPK